MIDRKSIDSCGYSTASPTKASCTRTLRRSAGAIVPAPHAGRRGLPAKRLGRVGRWNCHACKSSFNVLSGTLFAKSRIPLQKWFLAVGIIVHAKKDLSSYRLARSLVLNQKTAWFMEQRIRAELANKQSEIRLQGIFEGDETFV